MASNSELFRNVVETVFNTWTALRLAVEHGMGGRRGKETALNLVTQVTDLFCKSDTEAEEVADFLIAFMDSEFQTICEDNSPDEVANVLWQFYQHCKSGNHHLVSLELSKLPKCDVWLYTPHPVTTQEEAMDCVQEEALDCVNMVSNGHNSNVVAEEHDSEWTRVKTRRRKVRME
jgi:pre-rRNA-processing protein TSR2